MEEELGKNFWLKTVGLVIGLALLGLLCMVIFTGLVTRFGIIAGSRDRLRDPVPDHVPRRQEGAAEVTKTRDGRSGARLTPERE